MTHELMRRLLDGADFQSLFLELGWDNPPDTGPVEIKNTKLVAHRVADKKGVAVWVVFCDAPLHSLEKRRVSRGLRRHSPLGRLVILDTSEKVLFLWPELTTSGREHIVEHEYLKGRGGGDRVLQQLERILFTLAEQATLTLLAVRDRVRHSFNVEKVTNKFYEEFQTHRTIVLQVGPSPALLQGNLMKVGLKMELVCRFHIRGLNVYSRYQSWVSVYMDRQGQLLRDGLQWLE